MEHRGSPDSSSDACAPVRPRAPLTMRLVLAAAACVTLVCTSSAAAQPLVGAWHAGRTPSASGLADRLSRSSELAQSGTRLPRVSPALAGPDGGISGKVTLAGTSNAISGIEVCAFDNTPEFEGECATTSATGEYTLSHLQPGRYTVEFAPPFESKLNYMRQFYADASSEVAAQEVPVVAGAVVTGIDAALQEGGEIEGKVSSASEALDEIEVCAIEAVTQFPVGCGITNEHGEYTIVGLPTSEYYVRFNVGFEVEQNFAQQFYEGAASIAQAKVVSVTAKTTKPGIDATLTPGGEITGTVTSRATGAGLGGIEVCAFPTTAQLGFRCTTTGPSGDYDLVALSTAGYAVGFFSLTGEYMTQYYEDASLPADVKDVAVVAGSASPNVNAALTVEVPIDVGPPAISGTTVEGQTLRVVHGSWINAPTTFKDEWGRCASSGAITSCHTVAVGESYVLTAADVGHAIRVRESAANVGGAGEFAISAPTSPVLAPPTPQPHLSGPSGPPQAIAPVAGVLGTTTVGPSAAQIRALLWSVLAPVGKNAKIADLLRRGGYTVALNTPSAGELVVSWYLVPKGARLTRRRPVLMAAGRLSFPKSGRVELTIRVTSTGRALLRHARQIKLTADGRYTPSGEGVVETTKVFTLRH